MNTAELVLNNFNPEVVLFLVKCNTLRPINTLAYYKLFHMFGLCDPTFVENHTKISGEINSTKLPIFADFFRFTIHFVFLGFIIKPFPVAQKEMLLKSGLRSLTPVLMEVIELSR